MVAVFDVFWFDIVTVAQFVVFGSVGAFATSWLAWQGIQWCFGGWAIALK